MINFKDDPDGYAAMFLRQWNSHDPDEAVKSMAPDCVWEHPEGKSANGMLYKGVSAIKDKFRSIVTAIPDVRWDLVGHFVGDNFMIMEVLVTGTNAETKKELRFNACDILVFRGGMVTAKRSYKKVVQ